MHRRKDENQTHGHDDPDSIARTIDRDFLTGNPPPGKFWEMYFSHFLKRGNEHPGAIAIRDQVTQLQQMHIGELVVTLEMLLSKRGEDELEGWIPAFDWYNEFATL